MCYKYKKRKSPQKKTYKNQSALKWDGVELLWIKKMNLNSFKKQKTQSYISSILGFKLFRIKGKLTQFKKHKCLPSAY